MDMHWNLGGFGLLEVAFALLALLFWIVVIAAVILGIRWLIRAEQRQRHETHPAAPRDDPLDLLRQRYARGEVDEEEFERRRKTLTGG
ncbi:MAG TPA: SHOCT domain-containing protein [Candidatus Limnocylindrales bacterium]